MKKAISIFLVIVMMLALASCGKTATTDNDTPNPAPEEYKAVDINVATLAGPTGIGMVKLMDKQKNGQTANNYNFTLCSDPATEVVPGVVSGNFQIASVPVNLASALYNKTNGGVQVLAVNTAGVLYILENGNEINSFADLAGKTVYATGQGSTPEYILNYLLEKNGLTDKVTVEYESSQSHDELAAKAASGKVSIAMLPEPKVTATLMQNSDMRIALDLTKEFESATNLTLIQGCVIARKDFCEKNPEAVKKFLEEYKESIDFAVNNVDDTAALCEEFSIIPKAAIAKKAIPNCNIVFITGEEMKKSVSANLQIFFDADPTSIGGKMPADDFYYAK
ncbi:MAG: ABC transporter substrate-binding protein [Oscillospiraceae bacterium]|nr:ABC transporter substrate-binding protein [Oscillospiraceae bacterium]